MVCNIYAYSDSYKPLTQVPVVESVSAYNCPSSKTFILVLSQALYLGECQEPSLLYPDKMRSFGIVVDNVPKHLSVNHKSIYSRNILD
jgi:hypothetical protein